MKDLMYERCRKCKYYRGIPNDNVHAVKKEYCNLIESALLDDAGNVIHILGCAKNRR